MQNSQQAIADSSTKLQKEETTIRLNNSRTGRSGLDELVPSRYALKVGEIDVMVVSDGVLVHRTGGHTPGRSVVRLASRGDRLTFAGDAVFQVGFEHPDWYNGFEHDPEEAARVRVSLLRELAANRESLVATHLSFPSVCHVAVDGDVFRWVPGPWEY